MTHLAGDTSENINTELVLNTNHSLSIKIVKNLSLVKINVKFLSPMFFNF